MESIEDICKRVAKTDPDSLKNCNKYIQAVFDQFARFGVSAALVAGDANIIVKSRMPVAPFNYLGTDPMTAMAQAAAGKIVIGGWYNASGHGHVFVVVGGPSEKGLPTPWTSHDKPVLSRGGAPIIYNGSSSAKIPVPETQVDIAFTRQDEKQVVYAWLDDPRAKANPPTSAHSTAQMWSILGSSSNVPA